MNRRFFVQSAVAGGLCGHRIIQGQGQVMEPDLAKLADGSDLLILSGTVVSARSANRTGVRFPEGSGGGIACLKGIEFANGSIEVDIKGKDLQQQSFIGVVFHCLDKETHDAIYFRPFNFKAEDPARQLRAVQYVSHPAYPWDKLRKDHPGKYEQAVTPVPDPNDWFRARILVASPKVSVFVHGAKEPSLVVDQLSSRRKGLLGLWAGGSAGADFANLRVEPT